jgi:hypothetical protein
MTSTMRTGRFEDIASTVEDADVGDVVMSRLPYAAAGAVAAAVWGVLQPIDKRVAGYGYDDVLLLGTMVTRGRAAMPIGYLVHAANGAAFGLVYSELRRRTPNVDPLVSALGLAMAEHLGLFPLARTLDRHHPGVSSGAVPPTFTPRAFGQATWRHLLFGVLLGLIARRLAAPRPHPR